MPKKQRSKQPNMSRRHRQSLLLKTLTSLLLASFYGDAASPLDIAALTISTPRKIKLTYPKSVCDEDEIPHYSVLRVHEDSQFLLIGRKNCILRAQLENIADGVLGARLKMDIDMWSPCHGDNPSKHSYECQNHPQYILWNQKKQLFEICATHAEAPRRYTYDVGTNRVEALPRYTGRRFCASHPRFNSTAVMTRLWGKQFGGQAAVVSATFKDKSGIEPVITRPEVDGDRDQKVETSSSWLDNPNFVGSFEHRNHIYIFFREVAERGRSIQSRVARVCKDDVGAYPTLTEKWTSFSKARLNCSSPGAYQFYFDEIQSIHHFDVVDAIHKRFVAAVFKTNDNAVLVSTLCVFALDDIEKAFQSEFAELSEFGFPKPIASSAVPTNPRPGSCVKDSSKLGPDHQKFIKTHPMMYRVVPSVFHRPVFSRTGISFRSVTTDNVKMKDGRDVFVHFLGSDDGRLFRVLQDGGDRGADVDEVFDFNNIDGVGDAGRLLSVYDVDKGNAVEQLDIWRKTAPKEKNFYLATKYTVVQLSVYNCKSYNTCYLCARDPYCTWLHQGDCVESLTRNDGEGIQSVYDSLEKITEECRKVNDPIPIRLVEMIEGGFKRLSCGERERGISTTTTYWTFGDEEIRAGSGDKKALTVDGSLILYDVRKSETGTYRCRSRLTGDVVAAFSVHVFFDWWGGKD